MRISFIITAASVALIGCSTPTEETGSTQIVINQPPSAPTVSISPEQPTSSDTLTCLISSPSTDPEGADVTYETMWVLDDDNFAGETLSPKYFEKGDSLRCTVTPSDGLINGETARSDAVSIRNTAPSITSVALTPVEPTVTDVLTCEWSGFTDYDEDPDLSTITWSINEEQIKETSSTLSSVFVRDDLVTCTVTPDDGASTGEALSATSTVVNSIPSIKSASFSAKTVVIGEPITCNYEGFLDDDDDKDLSEFSWSLNGTVVSDEPTLTDGFVGTDTLSCTVTPYDGLAYGKPLEISIEVSNTPPIVVDVSFGPNPAYIDDTLSCTPTAATDADGTTKITYTYGWEVDGVGIAETTNSLTGDFFEKQQAVACLVTPNDGFDDGEPFTTDSITILNSAPAIELVTITPETPIGTDTLTCTWSDYTDLDNDDDLSLVEWSVNGAVVGTDATLVGVFSGGDGVSCTVTPFDGEDTGAPRSSTIVVSQGAPSIGSVTITPVPALAADTLICSHDDFQDPDGDDDMSRLSWHLNGVEISTDETLFDEFVGGDEVSCIVTPYDGMLEGTPVSDTITIDNTPPTLANVSLSLESASTLDDIDCVLGETHDDDGTMVFTTTYSWEINGAVHGTSDTTLLSTEHQKGDIISCSASISDTIASSDTQTSPTLTIENSAPTLEMVVISPAVAFSTDTLTCTPSGYFDADGDTDETNFEWFVNEVSVSHVQTINGLFVGGDVVSCTATAYDGILVGDAVSDEITIENSLPLLADVSVSPESPTVVDTLICSAGEVLDVDGPFTGTFAYSWLVNGLDIGESTNTLTSEFFAKEDSVSCSITPNDGMADGLAVTSNEVTVINSEPLINGVVISPSPGPVASDTLTCSWTGFFDADDDSDQSTILWEVNNVAAGTTDSLSGLFSFDDDVSCTVTPFDGQVVGESLSTSVVIANTPPVLAGVELSPLNPTEADTLTCAPTTTTDEDGNILFLYATTWTINGTEIADNTETLENDKFSKGQSISCTVTPNDGTSDGEPVGSNDVTVLNSVPTLSDLTITPDPATTADTLSATYLFSDLDSDTDLSTYIWEVNGMEVSTDFSISGVFTAGDTVTLTVTPTDDESQGTGLADDLVVENSPPFIVGLNISPNPSNTTDSLNCAADDISDPDGIGTLIETWSWTRNGLATGDGSATLDASNTEKNDTIGCGLSVSDGVEDSGTSFATIVVQNSLPTITSVTVTPSNPVATDILTCSANGFTDADDDADASTVQWTVNGITAGTGTALAGGFSGTDSVRCTITPFDGQESGLALSDTVVVENTAPTITGVNLTPASIKTDSIVNTIIDLSDPDSDTTTYTYSWTVNGTTVAETGPSLDGALFFERDDIISVSVTANDGFVSSVPFTATTAPVANTAPSLTGTTISPDPAYANQPLTCMGVGPSDADSDTVNISYTWFINGAEDASTPFLTTPLLGGDVAMCRATPSDGLESGPASIAVLTVNNTAPTITAVLISPENPLATDTLTCNWFGFSDDDGDPDISGASWLVNGISAGTGTTLSGAFSRDDTVTCEVRPFDGENYGVALSNDTTILNSAPTILSAQITNDSPTTNDTLTTTVTTADADSDSVSKTTEWFVNGLSQGTSDTLDGTLYFEKTDTITATITPFDGSIAGPSSSTSAVIVQNSAPTSPALVITPVNPDSNDELTCTRLIESTDPDSDTLTYSTTWTISGTTLPFSTETLPVPLSIGDVWECSMTASDGDLESATVTTSATVQDPCVSVVFDGTASVASVSDHASLSIGSDDFTIELLAYFDDTAVQQTLIGSSDGLGPSTKWSLSLGPNSVEATQNLHLALRDPSSGVLAFLGNYTGTIPLDRWVHIAAVRDGTALRLFVDGTLVATDTINVDLPDPVQDLTIGALDASSYFIGQLDNVSISTSARYLTDFTPNFSPLVEDDTVALWLMNEASGAVTYDSGLNAMDLTLTATDWSNDSSCDATVNSPPSTPTVNIEPAIPTEDDDLLCDVTVPATDPEGDLVSYTYGWLLDGVDSGFSTSTLDALQTLAGDEWTCRATATDGLIDGGTGSASAVITVSYPAFCTPIELDSVVILCDDPQYWFNATSDCDALGGELFSASSPFLNTQITTELTNTGFSSTGFWLGASDTDGDGTWAWSDGQPWTYENWGAGFPVAGDTFGYLITNGLDDGKWATTSGIAETLPYACVLP